MKKLITLAAIVLAVLTARPAQADVILNLLDPYLRIHKNLIQDKIDNVASDAAAIASTSSELGADAAKLTAAAKALETAKDIKAVREAFGTLTEEFIAYAEKMKMVLPADLKVAYCPMVQKPWLQKSDEIANPYYGKEMLTCGSFKKK